MSQSLEERLRSNSNAFDGLLALIPAKYYYDGKTQEQWQAKKKTQKQLKQDKLKKLDPEQQDDETKSALEITKKKESVAEPVRLPGEKLLKLKKEQTKEVTKKSSDDEESDLVGDDDAEIQVIFDDEGNEVTETAIEENKKNEKAKKAKKHQLTEEEKKIKQKNLEELHQKLQNKIQSMKLKRKAPGTNVQGAPQSRESILLQRKRKQELKRKRVESEQQEASDSDSDSDIDDEPKTEKPNSTIDTTDIMFQSIVFDDGDRATSDLQRLRKAKKGKKGPAKNDIKAHLKLLEAKKSKVQEQDELEQIKNIEKSKWQKAMLQAEGVKMKDDEKLLRKALKRKEAKKRKSSLEWAERKRDVETNKQERVKRREENLKIRKENKGVKRSKQQKMKRKFKGVIAPKKRAGFEGRLKSGKK